MASDHDKRYKKLFSHPVIVKKLLLYFIDEAFIKNQAISCFSCLGCGRSQRCVCSVDSVRDYISSHKVYKRLDETGAQFAYLFKEIVKCRYSQ